MTKKETPTCELSRLKLKGKVIGVDSKGVMLTLFGEETMGMYIPFGVLGELPMSGSTVELDVEVDVDSKSMNFRMTMEDADQT